jgi:lactate dehydrogenase-like 2-hydroxyacid dehydrogenase
MNRRNFLLTAPAAAGVGLSIAELFASMVAAQNSTPTDTEANYMVYSAEEIEDDIIALQAKPGSKNLYRNMNFAIDLTVEKNTVAKELPIFNDLGRPFAQSELLAAAQGADALFVSPEDKLDAYFFEGLPESVKVIASFSVGYDHIDVGAAAKRGVPVANTPNVLTDATADIAILLLLGASRRASEGQDRVRSGRWGSEKLRDLLSWDLGGKTLGILCLGRIGRAVAHRARAFGLKIHYSNRQQVSPEIEDGVVFHPNADELLCVSNFLSLHAPSTPKTRHFLCRRRIEMLPAGAIIVNTARGTL